ncbi:sensor histidine kinase [Nocardioides conyzicola]|uniref:histidine kinase n=2 Tax=Nocardioides conyzicola TaxID=1651781 RepID=A0ABP8WV14_9ACTN
MAEPGRFQVLFSVLYAVDVGLRVAFGARFDLLSGPGLGLVGAVVLFVLGVAVPWDRLDPRLALVLPVGSIAVVGVTRLAPEGGNGLLAVFPALWLGRQWGRRGAVIAGVATVLFLVVPGAVYSHGDSVMVPRVLFIALVVVVTALAVADGMEQVQAHEGTIEHQRRVSQAIFDTVDVGLLLLGKDGEYVGMNRRHQEFMAIGYPAGHEGQAGQLGEVYDVDGRTPMRAEQMPAYRASAEEEFDDVRMWIGRDPATRRALSVSARAVRTRDGAFAGAALAYNDVTDFMRALKVKDEFVALVSHELRTPLTSIVGYVQILEEDPAIPPHAVEQLRVVHRNAERLRRLIGDLLDTAQRDGSPMPINRSDADLAAIVVESVEAARPTAAGAGVDIALTAPEQLRMSLDAQRIAQAVDNLLSNAIKYTEPGGAVTVRLAADERDVELEVVDTGIGIAPDDCDRLFTRFFRTEDAARRAVAGAGLGLSITKDIVESHGGRVDVESEVGRGSTFRVRLPSVG